MSLSESYTTKLARHYSQVRQRLWLPRPKARQKEKLVRLADEPQIDVHAYEMSGSPLTRIMHEVARKHGLTVMAIRSDSHGKKIVQARHEYFYRAVTETTASYPAIARFCGGKDHTTAMHGVRRYCWRHGLTPPRGLAPWQPSRPKPKEMAE